MKILVYGAGPLGSAFAAKLHQGGHDVGCGAMSLAPHEIRERLSSMKSKLDFLRGSL